MIKKIFAGVLALLIATQSFSFCGFYVAKAGTELFNNKSEVIFVRQGERSTITMSSDFKGDTKDFAMVVPVPVVLKEKDIKVVRRDLFEKWDKYSSPRLVEYYDASPCMQMFELEEVMDNHFYAPEMMATAKNESNFFRKDKVTIEAEYKVENYDILILSAEESDGLKNWLERNDYQIPDQAEEVLEPYIKSGMKFFVVKVNMKRHAQSQNQYLNPLQISFESPKFMLPIRLGMANSTGEQDMIMYFLTDQGRVETTNYRTVNLPTGNNIPLYAQKEFGQVYKSVFDKQYKQQNKNAVFLEYAWNVSPNWGGMKCDPCVGDPPIVSDLQESGVNWANGNNVSGVYFTRMHVRYSRDKFPQDLQFQVTPNKENYQVRYVLHHPASGDLSCEEGQAYLIDLQNRRRLEVEELAILTGNEIDSDKGRYLKEYAKKEQKNDFFPVGGGPSEESPLQGPKHFLVGLGLIMLALGLSFRLRIWVKSKLPKYKLVG